MSGALERIAVHAQALGLDVERLTKPRRVRVVGPCVCVEWRLAGGKLRGRMTINTPPRRFARSPGGPESMGDAGNVHHPGGCPQAFRGG